MIKIKQGLDLPIKGRPEQVISDKHSPSAVALLGADYPGLRPAMAVKQNDTVVKGQLLFGDKNLPDVRFTAPAAGKIKAIHRGERRKLLSVVIELSGDEELAFDAYSPTQLAAISVDRIKSQLLESGLWTALRTRPFNKVANPAKQPHSIFITAIDSNPLAPEAGLLLTGREPAFEQGVQLLAKLTHGRLYLCKSPQTVIPDMDIPNLQVEDFVGPHPAGLVGTHIHFLDPVHREKTVWHIGLQDVIAIGRLFLEGCYPEERIVSLAGPSVIKPRLIKTRLGADLADLVGGELAAGEQRIISGSVLSGFHAKDQTAYLGRYHQQVSVLPEDRRQEFLDWLSPGLNRFSLKRAVLSRFLPGRDCDFTTSINGESRAIIPTGNYEKVMPLDIMPLFLIRALAVQDADEAEKLGCLELDEEDLAICAFVCPSKQDFGPMLRRTLDLIEEEIHD